ncbi:methyl-accepting chemotaxis protein [Acidovorax sp. SUPP3334]|uniref:methyl-accepting chemotaxis protein n=1 Tax=Acidovorax sp. SUPP3334 TaxID=2920881 RepID=UPI0023DE4509|nr:methyl-accepting chemotaxis protein [Acidovorax sp. SUPP3334]GKT23961.1 hypothetical protein AVHM3334_13260 [Acidovorax sp. SUPP3334]
MVASEVRSLANRSAEAAREIKALIAESVQQVASGASLAGHAGRTMERVVSTIQNTAQTMGEIRSHTQSQNQDIAAIHAAMSRIDEMTQQNAALVEQSAAAAASLRGQAHDLSAVISQFALPQSAGSGEATPRAAHPSAPAPAMRLRLTHA